MKYKVLKSAAHNFGRSFASTLNWRGNDYVMSHLDRAAVASGEVELNVDLLSGSALPPALLAEPVQASVADYVRWFPDLLRSQRIAPEAVRVATLRVRFQPERRVDLNGGTGGWTIPFECLVSLTDDHGTIHQGRLVGHWGVNNFNVPPPWRRRGCPVFCGPGAHTGSGSGGCEAVVRARRIARPFSLTPPVLARRVAALDRRKEICR